jgi:N-acetylmuramoyl-L-alanine amidase
MFSIFLFSLLKLLSPEIYHFNDSVKVLIKKEGYLDKFKKKIENKEFVIIFSNAIFDSPLEYNIENEYLKSIEVNKEDTNLIFKFKITENVKKYRIKKEKDKIEIVFFGEKIKDEKRKIKKIVIDPGHGGEDPGACGKNGTKEKDVNLQVSKILKKLIEKELKLEVILTRERDTFLSLGERSKIANTEKADIFLSIHCNASKNPFSSGPEVYFLSEAKTDWERAVEALENASLKFEMSEKEANSLLDAILSDLAQTEFLKESQKLAEFLQKNLVSDENLDRGVKQAGFYVLLGAYMPSALIEIGFITNPEEEKKLRDENYIEKICKKILKGLKEFINWYEK